MYSASKTTVLAAILAITGTGMAMPLETPAIAPGPVAENAGNAGAYEDIDFSPEEPKGNTDTPFDISAENPAAWFVDEDGYKQLTPEAIEAIASANPSLFVSDSLSDAAAAAADSQNGPSTWGFKTTWGFSTAWSTEWSTQYNTKGYDVLPPAATAKVSAVRGPGPVAAATTATAAPSPFYMTKRPARSSPALTPAATGSSSAPAKTAVAARGYPSNFSDLVRDEPQMTATPTPTVVPV